MAGKLEETVVRHGRPHSGRTTVGCGGSPAKSLEERALLTAGGLDTISEAAGWCRPISAATPLSQLARSGRAPDSGGRNCAGPTAAGPRDQFLLQLLAKSAARQRNQAGGEATEDLRGRSLLACLQALHPGTKRRTFWHFRGRCQNCLAHL